MPKLFDRLQSFRCYSNLSRRDEMEIESLLYGFCLYALPIVIMAATLIAIMHREPALSLGKKAPFNFSHLDQGETPLEPQYALSRLCTLQTTTKLDAILSETPVWFLVTDPGQTQNADLTIEIPSRHTCEITCWDAAVAKFVLEKLPAKSQLPGQPPFSLH